MTLRPGEVVLIRIDFPYRPRTSSFDVPIHQWREAGLNTASTIRVHKLPCFRKTQLCGVSASSQEPIEPLLAEVPPRAFSLDW